MGNLYCSRADLYKFGLPRGVLGTKGDIVEASIASTDTLTFDGHGFETDTPVMLRAAEGGTLSAPLVASTIYYAIRVSDATFKVAATAGGAVINLTTDGTSMIVSTPLDFDDVIEAYSRWVDGFVPHIVPFVAGSIPIMVKMVVAELSAKKLLALAGHSSELVDAAVVTATAQLERWAKGVPVRDALATASSNRSVVSSITILGLDPRGWGSGELP